MSAAEILGMAAGGISLAAYVLYWVAIVGKKTTKPKRTTWFIWSALNVILTLTYYKSGAQETIWMNVGCSIGSIGTAILSIKYGKGGREKLDIACFMAGIAGLLLWAYAGPRAAFWLESGVDIVAIIPTLKSAWETPEHEDKLAWSVTGLAVVLNIVALFFMSELTAEIIAYPAYVFVMDITIVILLFRRKKAE